MKDFMKNTFLVFTLLFLIACKKEEEKIATPIKSIVINSIEPAAGSKNALILLSGSGFSEVLANNIVTLNGKNCAVIDGTSTELIISIPPAAGSGNIKVSADGGIGVGPNFEFLFTYTVSNFAGSGNIGYDNGQGDIASFAGLTGISTDAEGNIYVCEKIGNMIKKISPAGFVSTLAGSETAGNLDGEGTNAKFDQPVAITVDEDGIIYTADAHTIKKITANGSVSTIAGGSISGFVDNALGLDARFNYPNGIATDEIGNLFISDCFNNRIRKIIPLGGLVSSYAGSGNPYILDGSLLTAEFWSPISLTFDSFGNLYTADYENAAIRKIAPNGMVTSIMGQGFFYEDEEDRFIYPTGIAADNSGNLYVSDYLYNRIIKITQSGIITTIAGTLEAGDEVGIGLQSKFNHPHSIAIDLNGNLYVTDQYNHKVKKITID